MAFPVPGIIPPCQYTFACTAAVKMRLAYILNAPFSAAHAAQGRAAFTAAATSAAAAAASQITPP
jgi:hypothetical protein